MLDFLEEIKENAEASKREILLGVICGFLLGVILGVFLGGLRSKSNTKNVFMGPGKDEGIYLSPEDYD